MDQRLAGIRQGSRMRDMQAALASDYQACQYRFVEFFIEHIVDVGRRFGGDLQAVIIVALVGQVHMRATRVAIETGQDPLFIPLERRSTTASRIADITGIPRETVRRKLALLEAKGWILRNANGSWQMATSGEHMIARSGLAELEGRAIARAARLFRDLENAVAAPIPSDGGMSAKGRGVVSM